MKNPFIYLAFILLFFSCADGQATGDHAIAALPKAKPGEQVATFGGGCFWAMGEAMSELKGVNKVIAGYAGGTTKNPTYNQVCTQTTGHAETVQVYYNPRVISYEKLAEAFFYAHDPTTLNRQGPDEGTDYRSIAFYRNADEKNTLLNVVKKINTSKHYSNALVTQIVPFTVFYPAEKYHQGYYKSHGDSPYIQNVSVPKVEKMRKMVRNQLKPEFQNL